MEQIEVYRDLSITAGGDLLHIYTGVNWSLHVTDSSMRWYTLRVVCSRVRYSVLC